MGKPSFLTQDTDDEGFSPEERAHMDSAPENDEPEETTETQEPEAGGKPEQPEGKEPDAKPRGGDLGVALREAREESKGLRDRLAKVEGAWQTIQQRMNAPPTPPPTPQQRGPEIPDFEKDPIGHLRAQNQRLEDELKGITTQHRQRTQQEQQLAQVQQSEDRYNHIQRDYARRNPDYVPAKQHLSDHWDGILIEMGYTDPQQRSDMLGFWEGRLAGEAMISGRNPAEAFHKAAMKVGYKPKGSEPPPQQEDKLARLQKGAKAASSLSATKNAPNGNSLPSLEEYAVMMENDPEAADKLWDAMARSGRLG